MTIKTVLNGIGRGLMMGLTDRTTIGGVIAIGAGALGSPALGAAVKKVGEAVASGDAVAIVSAGLGAALVVYQGRRATIQ